MKKAFHIFCKFFFITYFFLFTQSQSLYGYYLLQNQNDSPEFNILFQNPSYIVNRDDETPLYNCDREKEECRINFKLTNASGGNLSSSLTCTITIWNNISGDFSQLINQTNTEEIIIESCNPNTIVFPEGISFINFHVYKNSNNSLYSERNILISNHIDTSLSQYSINKYLDFIDSKTLKADVVKNENIETVIDNLTYSQEAVIQRIISDEAIVLNSTIEKEQETIGEKIEEEKEEILDNIKNEALGPEEMISPGAIWEIQNPSYIEDKIDSQNLYTCDNSKDTCKINLNFLSNNGKTFSSKLSCTLSSTFPLENNSEKCNPSTIIIPEGKHTLTFQLFQKENNALIEKHIIHFNNIAAVENTHTPEIIGEHTQVLLVQNTDTNNNLDIQKDSVEEEKNIIPNFFIHFQQPSYIINIGNNSYVCDNEKEECRVNFQFLEDDNSSIGGEFGCQISAKFELGENGEKCNPNTLTIPEGKHSLLFTIYEKDNPQNQKSQILSLQNIEIAPIEKNNIEEISSNNVMLPKEGAENIVIDSVIKSKIDNTVYKFPFAQIEVQGSLGKSKKLSYKKITCYTYGECSINFTSGKFTTQEKKETEFVWKLGKGENYYGYNPPSKKYTPGRYNIELIMHGIDGSKKTHKYEISVIQLYTKSEIKSFNSGINIMTNIDGYFAKKYFSDEINTYNNFITSYDFYQAEKQESEMSMSDMSNEEKNGDTSQEEKLQLSLLKKNISLRISLQKKSLKIYGTTVKDSKILLTIGDNSYTTDSDDTGNYEFKLQDFPIGGFPIMAEVYNQEGELIAKKASSNKDLTYEYFQMVQSYIKIDNQITGVNEEVNTKIVEENNDIESTLKKNISLRVSLQKKNLKIYGTTEVHSQISIFIGDKKYLATSNKAGEYELKIKDFPIGDFPIIAEVHDKNGLLIAKKQSAEKDLSKEYFQTVQSYHDNSSSQTDATSKNNLSKNISLRVSLQKKNLKIYGTTEAHSNIEFTIGNQKFYTFSDDKGDYTFKTNQIIAGNFTITAKVYNKLSILVAEKTSAVKIFSQEYISKMQSYINSSSNTSNSLYRTNSTIKTKKFSFEDVTYFSNKIAPPGFNINVFLLNLFTLITTISLFYIILIKRKLI